MLASFCLDVSRLFVVGRRSLVPALLAGMASGAWAQETETAELGNGLFSRDAFSAVADVRLVGADGEQSWLDGGFGKTRFGAGDPAVVQDFRMRPYAIEGDLIWQPKFSWSLSGTVVATAQHGQEHPIDLSEAFLTYKPLLPGNIKVSARAGLFWPPVSLEHGGPEWRVLETITPSAINSWIGDEVKVGGAEIGASTMIGNHRLSATAALFGLNDTSGTLLAFRGWALHDEKATAFGLQPLPPLNAFMQDDVQAAETRPVIELDDRPGYYVKLGWQTPGPLGFEAFHYDNRGDPEAVTPTLQWGWDTRFDMLSAVYAGDVVELKIQGLSGCTEMGFPLDGAIWVDTHFRAGYLMATRKFDRGSVSARIEAFGTSNHGSTVVADDDEDGWAITAAARRAFGEHLELLVEALHVESSRGARVRNGLDPEQEQTVVQVSLRARI